MLDFAQPCFACETHFASNVNEQVPTIRKLRFAKYHAAANDFIVVSAADLGLGRHGIGGESKKLAALARAILARHTGLGADGLFVIWPAMEPKHDAAVKVLNADGSEAEMSGNGIRCAAAWLLRDRPRLRRLAIETAAGVKTAELIHAASGQMVFRVAMGEPILDPKRVPFEGPGAVAPIVRYALPTSQGRAEVTVTSMGNPHCSTFVDNFDDLDWRSIGREIERHPFFPNRTNVEFVRVLGPSEIEVRFWERGVGETASSGTGSSAATVAAVLNGLTARKVRVETPGGELQVEWSAANQVFLTGPVQHIAEGKYEYHDQERGTTSGKLRGGRARTRRR